MTGMSPPFAKFTVLVTRRVLPGRTTPHAFVAKVVPDHPRLTGRRARESPQPSGPTGPGVDLRRVSPSACNPAQPRGRWREDDAVARPLHYAALGSSFAAGPGISPIIDQPAIRSGRNYPHVLAERRGPHRCDDPGRDDGDDSRHAADHS